MGMGGGTSTQTTTQELSPEQRALIRPVIPIATDYLDNPPQMFPGSGIAGFNPLQQMAQQMQLSAAQNMMPGMQQIPQQMQALMSGWGSNVNAAGQQGTQGQNQLNAILAAMGGSAGQVPGQVQGQTQGIMQAIGGQAGNMAGNATNTSGQIQGQNQNLNQQLMQAFSGLLGQAGGTQGQVNSAIGQGNAQTSGGLNFLAGGDVLRPESNAALQAAIQGASRPVIENFQNNILPGIGQEAVTAGGYGGSRHGIAEGLAAQGVTRQVGDIASSMSNQNYQTGLQAMLGGLNTQVGQQGQNLQAMLGAGQQGQNAAQGVMQGILGGANTQQAGTLGAGSLTNQAASQIMQSILGGGQLQQSGTLGAAGLQQDALGRMIQGNLGGQGAANSFLGTQQQGMQGMQGLLGQQGNIAQQSLIPGQIAEGVGSQQQMMQQAMLSEQVQRFVNQQMMPFAIAQDVASMAFGMPGGTTKTTATGGNQGGGLQAGLGALSAIAPLFAKSDRKLKEKIRKISQLYDGLYVYVFKLKDECIERVGLMADEVLERYPLAVIDNGEYLMVRYDLVPSWHMRARRY